MNIPFPSPVRKIILPSETCPREIAGGLDEVRALYPERFDDEGGDVRVRFAPQGVDKGFSLRWAKDGDTEIAYDKPTDAFRALGLLMGQLPAGAAREDIAQHSRFSSLGMMLDVSRNAVLKPSVLRRMIGQFALMGINQLMLYTEDTYEIPEEPMFGYFRGRYTQEDLRGIDAHAALFGIEVVPCIQTLGHLEEMLHWPAYAHLRDTADILLAGDPAVEAFIEKMIDAAIAPFRSRRIHIGMDEAHGIGSGQYRRLHGPRAPFEILSEHLERVMGICRKRGLSPMIWGDMYFRLGSKTDAYYDRSSVIPEWVSDMIPKDVQLVYWDYFRTDLDFCREWIARHRALNGRAPVFAGGVWTWDRFWTMLPRTYATLRTCMRACREGGVQEAFGTFWGDDGMECDLESALPGIQFFAECGYADKMEDIDVNIGQNLLGSCGISYEAWTLASALDAPPGVLGEAENEGNISKWLLWHDPLLGFLEKHIDARWPEFYADLAKRLWAQSKDAPMGQKLEFPARLAQTLSLKAELHLTVRAAYAKGDAREIADIAESLLPNLRREVEELWQTHHCAWNALSKPFGWETIERRYGGLLLRLDRLRDKLRLWLKNPRENRIEELEEPLSDVYPTTVIQPRLKHWEVSSSSVIR